MAISCCLLYLTVQPRLGNCGNPALCPAKHAAAEALDTSIVANPVRAQICGRPTTASLNSYIMVLAFFSTHASSFQPSFRSSFRSSFSPHGFASRPA